MLYSTVLFIHVISAVLSIGPFFVLIPMLKKMRISENHDEMTAFVTTFSLAIQVVKHAGHILILSGLYILWQGGYPITSPFIVLTFTLLIASIVFLARAFKPTMRTFNTPQYNKEYFVNKLRKAVYIYTLLLLIMLWFMVTKPPIW
ncbi:hypothetical protein [Rummeliibacillus sp. POC4]|uniref:hypothetical protein n=1 Tax=Rummeliibacillus sp. POC4 TaxID=2305899 RepID=UPI000E66C62A|nr:hypothetical protein [Rummeliibacillus sp. POC4]RIJ64425.1 hypothetical protein D1606_10320 [Rummeliibacillus sp. POC4]